jgi:amidase
MSSTEELGTAAELLARLRGGQLGSLELLDAQLERIERLDGELNAVVALDADAAREAARAADNAPAGGRGPLHGLPMTIKDSYEVAGMPATCGFAHLAGHVPARDADAVARLRAAGAIPFGKTNLPMAAADHQSFNPLYGTTSNPWDTGRTPGGSSGGAAAAVAAGFTPLELGSDIGGSIRCPAHFCGVYGHKPSYGMVPLRGHIPPDPGELLAPPLGVAGPLARSAADLELALDVLAPAPPPHSRHERLDGFRVALWADGEGYSVDARCLEAMHGYAEDLRRLGVTVDEAARPEIDLRDSDDLYVAMLFATVSAGMPEELLAQTEAAGAGADPGGYPARIAKAVRLTHHEFVALQERQLQLQEAWRRFFEDVDLILCPVMPTVAFPHDHSGDGPGHIAQYTRTTIVDGRPVPYMNGLQWPGLVTVANLPATALPTGRLIDGLPMGIQAVGPFGEDRTPLRFAALAEREIAGFRAPPL